MAGDIHKDTPDAGQFRHQFAPGSTPRRPGRLPCAGPPGARSREPRRGRRIERRAPCGTTAFARRVAATRRLRAPHISRISTCGVGAVCSRRRFRLGWASAKGTATDQTRRSSPSPARSPPLQAPKTLCFCIMVSVAHYTLQSLRKIHRLSPAVGRYSRPRLDRFTHSTAHSVDGRSILMVQNRAGF